MRIARSVIISVILALGTTGSVMAAMTVSASAAVHASGVHAEAVAAPGVLYHE
jgi:hypothetical protein